MESKLPTINVDPTLASLPFELQALFADPVAVANIATQHGSSIGRVAEIISAHDVQGAAESVDLYKHLITIAATETSGVGQNERDAATVIVGTTLRTTLEIHPYFNRAELVDHYVKAVRDLPEGSDYFGTPHSMYEMGDALFTALGPTDSVVESYRTKLKVRGAWNDYLPRITDTTDRAEAGRVVEGMMDKVFPLRAGDTSENRWEWARRRPPMDAETTLLHDAYLAEVSQVGSYKPYLIRNTPKFQEELSRAGITIEDYWNTTNPQRVLGSLRKAQDLPGFEPIMQLFDKSFSAKYGFTIEDLLKDPKLALAMADQVTEHMTRASQSFTDRMHDPEDVYSRLQQQIEEALIARRPGKRLGPVRKFLESYGALSAPALVPEFATAQELRELFLNSTFREMVLHGMESRNQQIMSRLEQLRDLFPENPYMRMKFMDRSEVDLYTGDDTRDCTAYHLANGFNAWTVPHWLANPGFNMAYLHSQGARIAKVGMQLASDEKGLRLVVDSIEVNKMLPPDHNLVLHDIALGILDIQRWADDRGLGDVICCTYTNSSELTAGLPICNSTQVPKELRLFAEMVGLQEVWQSISDKVEPVRVGYVQSQETEDEDEDEVVNRQAIEEALHGLELTLAHYATPTMTEAAQKGDWDAVVEAYIDRAAPTMRRLFGQSNPFYGLYLETRGDSVDGFYHLIEDQRGEVKFAELALAGVLKKRELDDRLATLHEFDWVRVADIEPLLDTALHSRLKYEAGLLDSLEIHQTNVANYMTIGKALSRIFGQNQEVAAGEDDGDTIVLRTNMPIVDRSLLTR